MFSSALKVLALAAVALALPATESMDATAVSEVGAAVEVPELADANDLNLCTEPYPTGCLDLPTTNGLCINIPGTHINPRGGRVPPGNICTFFRNQNCPGTPLRDMVILNAGIYDLTQLFPNPEGNMVSFPLRRSYLCRPAIL